MAALLTTRDETEALRQRVHKLARRIGIALPASLQTGLEPKRFFGEDTQAVVQLRQTIRLFALVYSLTNVYENILIGLLRRKRLSQFLRDLVLRSSAGFAAFIAVYSITYRLLRAMVRKRLAGLAAVFGQPVGPGTPSRQRKGRRKEAIAGILRSQSLASAVAGAMASPALLLDPSPTRRTTMALYALSRALENGWRAACLNDMLPRRLQRNSWWFGPHLIFALANAQLLHAFVYDPDCFPPSYSNFILRFSDGYIPKRRAELPAAASWPQPRQLIDLLATTSSSQRPYPKFESKLLHPNANLPVAAEAVRPVLDLAHPLHSRLVCATLHPDEAACSTVASTFARREFLRATRFMLILSAIRIVLGWRKARANPLSTLTKAAHFSVSSGAAIAGCIGVAWSSICFFQTYLPATFLPTQRFYLQGFLAGLFVLLSPARSGELGMYSARLAALSAWQVADKRGRVRSIRYGELVPFAIGAGALMALHERGPAKATTGMVKRVLDRVSPAEEEQAAAVEGM